MLGSVFIHECFSLSIHVHAWENDCVRTHACVCREMWVPSRKYSRADVHVEVSVPHDTLR